MSALTTEFRPVNPTPHWDEALAVEIIGTHAGLEGATLPILHALQEEFGCVPHEAVPLVAEALNLSRAEVHGVVTFYHDFRAAPPGRHVLKLCRAESCQSRGAEALSAGLLARLGINWGGTTADGSLTVEPVFCLGLCACAPSAMMDGRSVARVTETKLDALVQEAQRA
ncbi:formate dehydrogenase subunit gamma [Roseomonas chloroacetimidivorans]|jgi:formate dehydrogenase subunit gamma|uniref:formate dehydrogenase subunit gamma n=1 Tax=Roseomonas chloroacetimidivorans TaxID=1766656 RepID=UPI003C74A8E2